MPALQIEAQAYIPSFQRIILPQLLNQIISAPKVMIFFMCSHGITTSNKLLIMSNLSADDYVS
jgi:hypothetical protein